MLNVRMVLTMAIGMMLMGAMAASADTVKLLDDCDPTTGMGTLRGAAHAKRETSPNAEGNAELLSPLADAVIGHQAWRNDPTYLKIGIDETVKVKNAGGRLHTFTKVANFGAGRIPNPNLNFGLDPAPECLQPSTTDVRTR